MTRERHTCHAEGCPAHVPPRRFACHVHWGLLPKPLQTLIWRYYREGQEIDKRPSTAYLAVQQLAVAYLAFLDAERTRHAPAKVALPRAGERALSNARNWSLVAPPEVETACRDTWTAARKAAWPVWREVCVGTPASSPPTVPPFPDPFGPGNPYRSNE